VRKAVAIKPAFHDTDIDTDIFATNLKRMSARMSVSWNAGLHNQYQTLGFDTGRPSYVVVRIVGQALHPQPQDDYCNSADLNSQSVITQFLFTTIMLHNSQVYTTTGRQ